MSQRQISIQLHGFAREVVRPIQNCGFEKVLGRGIVPGGDVSNREPGVGAGVVWVDGKRLLEQASCFLDMSLVEG